MVGQVVGGARTRARAGGGGPNTLPPGDRASRREERGGVLGNDSPREANASEQRCLDLARGGWAGMNQHEAGDAVVGWLPLAQPPPSTLLPLARATGAESLSAPIWRDARADLVHRPEGAVKPTISGKTRKGV